MDIEKTFNTLSGDSDVAPILATSVERFAFSPITFWCELHALPEARDGLDLYQQHLMEVGQQHQTDVIDESYSGAVQEIFTDEKEGFRRTLGLMAQGEKYIKNMPLICRPIGLQGRPDLLIRVDGAGSELGQFSYHVVEIKSAKNIQDAHLLQAAVYNRLLGWVQGYEPEAFYIVNRDGDMTTVQMAGLSDQLDEALWEMRRIIGGGSVEPCYGAGKWPWESYVNQLAIDANDVSLLSGVGATTRKRLASAGFGTVEAVADAETSSLTAVKGIGPATAEKHVSSAKAIAQGTPVRLVDDLSLLQARTEVFLDLEGTDPRLGSDGLQVVNYLIGALVRQSHDTAEFRPFFAPSFDDEEGNVRTFFDWAASLDDALFFHWHNYERTHLRKLADFYRIDEDSVAPVMDNLVDVFKIATSSFSFPAYGEGLKPIARCLGFSWRQEDVSALTSIVLYRDYVGSGGEDEEARRKILDYNEDDCRATMHVYDWLLSQRE